MSTFFMFGKYSDQSVKEISEKRTRQVMEIVEELGGEIKDMYAVLGAYDLVLIVRFPNMADALKASVAMSQSLGISFSTLPAMPIEEFDRLVGK
ncbi:MAG: GYD domain-containing protein [Methanobacteriota archaeon]|nr:MAG: GYD domain-containing protein [Euryarchaeota archaeon]